MLEPTPISPMLDNFAMGGAISEHHGVQCFPAMENQTDGKYIVKVISIPASQTQLDALLISGAYSSKDSALVYFKELTDGVLKEVEVLNKLSKMEGFLPIQDVQCVPMDGLCGYKVYLLSQYRRTLEKQFRRNPLTHLDAVNLGLDLCAALAVCRRSGYLYVALKPNNVYVTPEKKYRIGDLGFIELNSLKYTSLPDKYHSRYTPPEIKDAFSSLNTTLDVYALGLILYQVYNNGALPFDADSAPEEAFPAPAYADYEMSEIILKACSPDPASRWQDPMEMGQAIVSYMQRNGANDTPIVPPSEPIPECPTPESTEEEKTEEIPDTPEEAESPSQESVSSEDAAEVNVDSDEQDVQEDVSCCIGQDNPNPDEPDCSESEDSVTASDDESISQETEPTIQESEEELIPEDETDPGFSSMEITYDEISDEVSDILTQADELVSHPVPDPVIAPEPVEVPIPEPLPIEPEPEAETAEDSEEEDSEAEDTDVGAEESDNTEVPPSKAKSHWLRNSILTLLLLAMVGAGLFYYQRYYLIPIEKMELSGDEDSLTVQVTAQIDESLLTAVCSDTYGTRFTAPVQNGIAVFHDLVPDTGYNVTLEIEGFHKLVGASSAAYSTPVQSNIVQFSAVTGSENGSVILGFTVEGPDSPQWCVAYSTEGEEEKTVTFPSHMVTITGLTVGKEYTFRLAPQESLYVRGISEVTHVASNLVYAENLSISSLEDGKLTVSWNAPADTAVDSWTVRCYNTEIYNESIVTPDTSVIFENLDAAQNYTVEVTAAGMSVAQRTYVSENSVTFRNFQSEITNSGDLIFSWETDSEVPENGWAISYSIDGTTRQDSLSAAENKLVIPAAVPGALYHFTIQDIDGGMVLGFPEAYQMPEPAAFSCTYEGYTVSSENMEFMMCNQPDDPEWNRFYLEQSDFTNTFPVGQKAAFLVRLHKEYGVSNDTIRIQYILRSEDGSVISNNIQDRIWIDMWYRGYCELNIPVMPDVPGNYTAEVYFNGSLAGTQAFSITE